MAANCTQHTVLVPHLTWSLTVSHCLGHLCLGLLPVMCRLHLWNPWLLFMWQQLWLLVQAAYLLELGLDPVLLTSVLLGPSEP